MTHAQDLILCQRCTVYIIDKVKSEEGEDGEVLRAISYYAAFLTFL